MNKDIIKACGLQSPVVYNLRNFTQNSIVHKVLSIFCVPFGLAKYIHRPMDKWMKNIAVVAIAKNEGAYLREWLEFYRQQGIDNVILFDNDSTDDTDKIVASYVNEGFVLKHKIKGRFRQLDAYHKAVDKYKYIYKYMIFIDCDEFLFCKNMSIFLFVESLLSRKQNGADCPKTKIEFGADTIYSASRERETPNVACSREEKGVFGRPGF